jgi:hypothetical protein
MPEGPADLIQIKPEEGPRCRCSVEELRRQRPVEPSEPTAPLPVAIGQHRVGFHDIANCRNRADGIDRFAGERDPCKSGGAERRTGFRTLEPNEGAAQC